MSLESCWASEAPGALSEGGCEGSGPEQKLQQVLPKRGLVSPPPASFYLSTRPINTPPRGRPEERYGPWAAMTCPCIFVLGNRCPTLVSDVDKRVSQQEWGRGMWEIPAPSSQLHCKPKTLKNKVFILQQIPFPWMFCLSRLPTTEARKSPSPSLHSFPHLPGPSHVLWAGL